MQHYHAIEEVSLQSSWLTIGAFDGVHRGHQEIIARLVAAAKADASPAAVLTFFPHPLAVLRGLDGPFYLTHPDERARLLGALGVDAVITLPFTRQVAATSAAEFMHRLKAHLDLRTLLIGHDFALGRGREGTPECLRALGETLGYTVRLVSPVVDGDQIVSSTRIRTLLANDGNVAEAAGLLGRPYRLQGEVIRGAARGRTLGFPTANIAFWPEQILPANGVYACRALWQGKAWAAATNIGLRPTFNGEKALATEAYLLDFTGDLYGEQVTLEFIQRLRGEEKFSSIEALIEQIRQDVRETRQIFQTGSPKAAFA
ncbi:MAG: bifunctional riboflavin kinase/FAD synthetase [Chloroflexota bacterium]